MDSIKTAVPNVVRNDYFITIVTLIAIAYVSTFAPKLPESLVSVLDNIVVKFAIFFVIAFSITRKADVALISSLAVLAVVLGVQVYMPREVVELRTTERMEGGFQPQLQSRQAEITINKNGDFMENEPLNESWTQKAANTVDGQTLDWPGYEAAPLEQVEAPVQAQRSMGENIVPSNNGAMVVAEGNIVGVSQQDMSSLEIVGAEM
jgi:hypothetical protein